MRKIIFSFIALAAMSFCKAQTCNCPASFKNMQTLFEESYAGFNDKVTAANRVLYQKYTDSLLQRSENTGDDFKCFELVKNYVRYFHDKHVNFFISVPDAGATESQVREFYKHEQQLQITESEILTALQAGKYHKPVEGIWQMGLYRVAILGTGNKNEYHGVVLESPSKMWLPGFIKFRIKQTKRNTFQAELYRADHSPLSTTFILAGDQLGDSLIHLTRAKAPDYKTPKAKPENVAANPTTIQPPVIFQELSPYTNYLRISSFAPGVKYMLDSIVSANFTSITKLPNLILDIRENGGGQDMVFDTLLSLAYTNEILNYNIFFRASPSSVERWKLLDPEMADSLKNHIGGYYVRRINNKKRPFVRPFPKQIILLVNRWVGSTAEQFVYYLKQSGKVTVMGENTTGSLDYSNLLRFPLACNRWTLLLPTSKNGWLPEYEQDVLGFTPDVYVPKEELDWVGYARRFAERRIGGERQ